MTTVLHLSDPHFGTEQPEVVRALQALAKRIQPNLLVLSGDITQRAQPKQFKAAREFMDSLGAPMLAIPGNHDIALLNVAARLLRPYARYRAAFGDDLEQVHASASLLVLCVNTTRAYRHSHGEVSAGQVERVAQRLALATPQQLRVVVVHQPIAALHAQDAAHLLRGHALARQRWASAGADVVLGGHIHLPYVMALDGLARPMWAVQAGTAVSTRLRPGVPNSVNVLHWGKDDRGATAAGALRIAQWDFHAAQQQFACARVTTVRPDRSHQPEMPAAA